MKRVFKILFLLFLLSSCGKERKVIRDIIGTWELTQMKIDGVIEELPEDVISQKTRYHFSECSSGKSDCVGVFYQETTFVDGETTVINQTFQYNIDRKKRRNYLRVAIETEGNYIDIIHEIQKLTDENMVLVVLGNGNKLFEYTFRKV